MQNFSNTSHVITRYATARICRVAIRYPLTRVYEHGHREGTEQSMDDLK